jgi:hypothetical protein
MYDENSDGLDQVNYEDLQTECDDTMLQAFHATGDRDIAVGVHPNGRFDYELWVDGGVFGDKTRYFRDFEEVREAIKVEYPNGDWEDVGW